VFAPLFKTATKMFETWLRDRQAQIAQRGQALEDEIRKLDGKIEQLMDKLVETDSDSMVKAYETRIKKLETDRAVLVEKSAQSLRPMRSFDAALRTALDFISNPHKLWSSGRLCDRHAMLKLAFPGGFQYHRNTGLRTAETPLPFTILGGLSSKQFRLAERVGRRTGVPGFADRSITVLRPPTPPAVPAIRGRRGRSRTCSDGGLIPAVASPP
jgi:site-specific DNA recombinase